VPKLALRLGLPLLVAAAAVVVVLMVSGGGSDGVRAAATRAQPAVVPAKPYVVLLVFDEFPGDALLDRHRRIDPVRYPNLAALAADGTWYRNAYSDYDSTTKAVPLILDGLAPRPGTSPVWADHPHSIFTAFGRRGYRVVASQEATSLCAPRWCPGATVRRPAIVPRLQSGRPERFDRFVATIKAGRPTLWVKHALLPHKPYLYLPSGDRTRASGGDPLPGMDTVPGFYDEYLTRHNEQRFLLQVGFVDRLVGKVLQRLKDQGIYDQTLVAITADHGVAFQVGVPTRRSVDDHNVEEIGPVPFVVKTPGQRRGRISDALVSTVDMTPTIASKLGMPLGYRSDGHPADGAVVRARRVVRIPNRAFTKTITISGTAWKARRAKVVARRLRQFGAGHESLYTGIGPHRALLGTAPAEDARAAASTVRLARLAQASDYDAVRRASGVVPTQVAGDLRGGRPGSKRALALAVNGKIEAVGRSFHLVGDRTEHFAFNVPEDALHDGANELELYEVAHDGRLRLIARV
jgi:sulfatase-like protein